MKQAGVVASPISKIKQPARARPANTAALKDAPEILGSLPSETLTFSTLPPCSFSNLSITHSPKLSAIASTAGGVKSTDRPFSPSRATPRTSEPFCSLLILSISSSTTTSLYFAVAEESMRREDLLKRNENEMRFVRNGFGPGKDDGKFILDIKLFRHCGCVEAEAMTGSKFGALNAFQRYKERRYLIWFG